MRGLTPFGPADITIRTAYEQYGSGVVPRAIWFEVSGAAPSLEQGREAFQRLADAIANVLCVGMNAAIEPVIPTVIFDATPRRRTHEYWQYVLPPDGGLPRPSRVLDKRVAATVAQALVGHSHEAQLHIAIGNFREAIRHALPGEWLLAVAHAWIGFEALKPVVLDQELSRTRQTAAQLGAAWGVKTSALENEARLRLLFPGRAELHRRLRTISNDLEHALGAFGPLQQRAQADAQAGVTQLRRAIFRCLFNPNRVPRSLTRNELEAPHACAPLQRQLHAVLRGPVEHLAPGNLQYPHFDVETTPKDLLLSSTGEVTASHDVTITPRLGPGVVVTKFVDETWGPP